MTDAEIVNPAETDLPCVTLIAHDLEVRKITRRYRIAQAVLFAVIAALFALCVTNGYLFNY